MLGFSNRYLSGRGPDVVDVKGKACLCQALSCQTRAVNVDPKAKAKVSVQRAETLL